MNTIIYKTFPFDLQNCFLSKSNYHFEMPFLSLARALTNDPNLQFTTAKVPMPPSVVLDPVLVDKYDHELSQADLIPLPHEDAEYND